MSSELVARQGWPELGIDRSTRVAPMRCRAYGLMTRDTRPRRLQTKNGHAAMHGEIRVTREYQSDSLSKHPNSAILLRLRVRGQ